MLTGGVSSAVSIATQNLGQREHVIYMVGNSGSTTPPAKIASVTASALSPRRTSPEGARTCVGQQLRKTMKAAYLVPDYTYGHSDVRLDEGNHRAGRVEDIASSSRCRHDRLQLIHSQFANSGADVFVNIAVGADAVSSTSRPNSSACCRR